MAIGGQAQLTSGGIDQQAQALVTAVATSLEACVAFNTWIAGPGGGAAGLVLFPAGGGRATAYAAGDATALINAFADMVKLRQVAHAAGGFGVANVGVAAVAQDFFVNARLAGGTNIP